MKIKDSSLSLNTLWRVTAGVAVLLIVMTFLVAVKARKITSNGFTGYISGQSAIVYLRSQPTNTSQTIAILNPGTPVFVDHSTTREDLTWYHVKTENGNGWIPETDLSLTSRRP